MNYNYFGIKLKWWQKLYINMVSLIPNNRGTSKTGLDFIYLLERLKRKAKTNEEKELYTEIQKQYGELCTGLTLGYWK